MGKAMQKWTPYRIYKIDLRPQNTKSTNINHKRLQRTANTTPKEPKTVSPLLWLISTAQQTEKLCWKLPAHSVWFCECKCQGSKIEWAGNFQQGVSVRW